MPSGGDWQSSDFDLYFSKNGANNLKLYQVLAESVTESGINLPTDVDDIPDRVTEQLDRVTESLEDSRAPDNLIQPDPIEEDVAPPNLSEYIDFVAFEAVYIVRSGSGTPEGQSAEVEVLLPVFVDVGLLLFFTRFATFEVYDKTELPEDPKSAITEIREARATPKISIANSDYLTIQESTETYELFIDSHLGLVQTLYAVAGTKDSAPLATVLTERYYIIARLTQEGEIPLPNPNDSGVLVRPPSDDLTYGQLVKVYEDWKHLANRLRIEHSFDAMQGLLQDRAGETNAKFESNAYETALAEDIADEFSPNISPLSTEEYLEVINE